MGSNREFVYISTLVATTSKENLLKNLSDGYARFIVHTAGSQIQIYVNEDGSEVKVKLRSLAPSAEITTITEVEKD